MSSSVSAPQQKKRRSSLPGTNGSSERSSSAPRRRPATVYDAVAGRLGTNGFLPLEQQSTEITRSLGPEAVLEQRNGGSLMDYDADKDLKIPTQCLPDSDLLRNTHQYVSDFYELTGGSSFDFSSLDETALLAVGILLEETCKEAIGATGDMVFTEPTSRDWKQLPTTASRHQVIGRVTPRKVQEYQSSSSDSEAFEDEPETPKKRARRRYRSPSD